MSSLTCWRVNTEYQLHWWHCGDEAVVYHAGSGDTHHLNTVAIVILESLQDAAMTCSQLTDKIAVMMEFDVDAEFLKSIESSLAELARLGLLESPRQ